MSITKENKENTFLGDQKEFAIEIGRTKDINKYKLCFWINGIRIGSFSKGGELRFAIDAFKLFWQKRYEFNLPVLQKMTPKEIDKYLVRDMFELMDSEDQKDVEEYERRKRFDLFFGPQFSNDGSSITLLYQDSKIRFVYVLLRKQKFFEHFISENTFKAVFDELIEYAKQ